jgi:hypothetical protein
LLLFDPSYGKTSYESGRMCGSSLRLKIPRAGSVSNQLEQLIANLHEVSRMFRPDIDLSRYSIDAGNKGLAMVDVGAREYHDLEGPPGRSDDRMSVVFRTDGELKFQACELEISHRYGGKRFHVLFFLLRRRSRRCAPGGASWK